MVEDFSGRSAVITGGSSGIGLATGRMLQQLGASVTLFARSRETLEPAATAHGMSFVCGDVSSEADVERLFETAESSGTPCDILVNAAGMVEPVRLQNSTLDQWERMFAVNVRGAFLACRRALPGMLARGEGSIINVSSISGIAATQKFPGFASYCASKAALIAMSEVLAVETRGTGVRVNCVSPGSVDTSMLLRASAELQPDMTPDEVAETIVFLAGKRSRPIHGQNIHLFSA